MLRGQVPQDRDPQEIMFNYISEVDDVWTLLFYRLLDLKTEHDNGVLKFVDSGELWYWGGTRTKLFAPNFVERWVPSFDTYKSKFTPDVIFCRGGFPQYHAVLQRFPNAIKIYYGAGTRFLPQPGFDDYDIVLVDSYTQQKIVKEKFPKAKAVIFFKPAPDNLFYPLDNIEKEYDICYPASGEPTRKGHDFIYPTVPKDLTILNLGSPTKRFTKPSNITSYRVLKSELPKHIQKCKIGIVVSTKGTGLFGLSYDSCPRIIPELLACGLPIVVLDEVEFWSDKYIKSVVGSSTQCATGEIVGRKNFWEMVRYVLSNMDKYNPREYYKKNLTIAHAASYLRERINEVSI
jgi:hypothetical protein